jgi:putative restriction endonuclease
MPIGEIAGVARGSTFASRRELYEAGVHRALQAGIVGAASTGAESVVLSGGYVDDQDLGSEIVYTGRGGRQIADQIFDGQNQALVTSCLQGLPVRLIRGAGAENDSPYSPGRGYRYDGLYRVESYWHERGLDGFLVCRYWLVADQPSTPSQTIPAGPAARIRFAHRARHRGQP